MKTIAVMNQKGGTGKTTSAINLAGELVRRGKKVLIVDMDTQGNATSNLQLTDVSPYTLTDVIVSKSAALADTICHTSIENLDLIRGGGLLAPDAQKALSKYEITLPKSILVDPQIFSVKTIDLASGLVRHYQRCYINLDRHKLDMWLLSMIRPSVQRVTGVCDLSLIHI